MEILMYIRPFSIAFNTHCHIHSKEVNNIIKDLLQTFDISSFLHSNSRIKNLNIQQIHNRFIL